MAKRFDTESFLSAIKQLLVNKLNAKIAAIEAEKIAGGFPATSLAPVDTTDGYFEQSFRDKNLNISPAVFYGLEDIKTQGIGPASAVAYKIFVEILYVDGGNDTLGKSRIHRYMRALKEVFEENYDQLNGVSIVKIDALLPISFKLEESSSEEIRIGGVSLTTSLA